MSFFRLNGICHRYERRGIYNLEEILPLIGDKGHIVIPGIGLVMLRAHRYLLMKREEHNLCCVECKIPGLFFALERCIRRRAHVAKGVKGGYRFTYEVMPNAEWHFNLYALTEEGHEVLMTKDHIVPKSKGGHHAMYNYQLMCQKCNSYKGNIILLPASSLELPETASAAVV